MKPINAFLAWIAVPTLLLTGLFGCGSGSGVELQGTGSSFDLPIFTVWFKEFKATHPDVTISYSAGGSGKGIADFTGGLTDFGASDAAMSDEQIAKVEDGGVLLVPITAGEVVVTFNLEGVKDLKLSRDALAGIFTGTITKWNDPAIAKTNDGVKLPKSTIKVVVRADSSGTTYAFTNHLHASSQAFKEKIGEFGTSVKWPTTGNFTQAPQNDGISKQVKENEGSIGYVEYAYASKNGLSMAALENKAGKFIAPSAESGAAALASGKLPENMRLFLPDPEGDKSYPIVTYSWMLVHKHYKDPKKAETLRDVIHFALTDGQKQAKELGYIPLPESVAKEVLKQVETIK